MISMGCAHRCAVAEQLHVLERGAAVDAARVDLGLAALPSEARMQRKEPDSRGGRSRGNHARQSLTARGKQKARGGQHAALVQVLPARDVAARAGRRRGFCRLRGRAVAGGAVTGAARAIGGPPPKDSPVVGASGATRPNGCAWSWSASTAERAVPGGTSPLEAAAGSRPAAISISGSSSSVVAAGCPKNLRCARLRGYAGSKWPALSRSSSTSSPMVSPKP